MVKRRRVKGEYNMQDITRNEGMELDDLFNKAKRKDAAEEKIEIGTNPLLEMQKNKNKGIVVVEQDDDDAKVAGGGLTEERMADVERTLKEMDDQTEKLKMVKITKKPANGAEMAALMDHLDDLDINELRRMADERERGEGGNIVEDKDVIGADISAASVLEGGVNRKDLGSGYFEAKSPDEIGRKVSEDTKDNTEVKNTIEESGSSVQVIIDKRDNPGESNMINFTEEEREKMTESTSIELIQIKTINVNTGKVVRPDKNFSAKFTTRERVSAAGSVNMTFVASRFRATLRGLTFGEYVDLSLSNDITDVETLKKKLTIIYKAIINTSIGMFVDFDDFCRNFAFKDVDLGTYALYMSTNSEVLETGLTCGLKSCKNHFKVSFRPRQLLRTSKLSSHFLSVMEKCATADEEVALEYHNTSSIIEKNIIELPSSGLAIEVGLRSCFDMIHVVLPFINEVEDYITEKYPEDTNKVRAIVTLITNYVSAVYFKDDEGNYTIRMDDLKDMVEVLYDLPLMDYEIINAIIMQTDEDYDLQFGIENVVCPSCGTKTEFVKVDIDQEVFRMFQELGSTRIDKKSLPRL